MIKRIARLGFLDIIKEGYFQLVHFLVAQGVNLDQRDSEKRTALMLCSFMEPEEWGVGISRLLLENGAHPCFRDRHGLNALQYAVIYERDELVNVFLGAIDFNLNAVDKLGNTALHYAALSGNSTITRLIAKALVKYRLKIDKRNNADRTALNEAVLGNKRKCVRVLEAIETQANITSIKANIPLDLKSVDNDRKELSIKGSKQSLARPKSSILPNRSTSSSHQTSERSYERSHSIYNTNTKRYMDEILPCKRHDVIEIPYNKKNPKNLIHCANMSNIKVPPEYLFQMLSIHCTKSREPPPKRKIRIRSAFVRRSEVENELDTRPSWRAEFRKVYQNYQNKCTASYRNPAVPPPTPANSEQCNDDIEPRKGRIKSTIRQLADENLLGFGKNRSGSRSTGYGGKNSSANDATVDSSNESIYNSKRQADGKISKSGKESSTRRHSRNGADTTSSAPPGADGASRTKPLKVISE